MINQTLTLEELKQRPFEEMFMDVARRQMVITIQLPGGNEVSIEPKLHLKPLPVLKGYIPQGWKDIIYNQD